MFKAEVVRVKVEVHPDADRLELLKVKGWQCVDQKGKFKTGDLVIYLPVDSVLPEKLVKDLAIEKFYSTRLKTIKLRNRISQGMCAPLSIVGPTSSPLKEGDDVTAVLGITKWEEPIPVNMSGERLPDHPSFFRYTDIENIKNFPTAIKQKEMIVISEKIHGTNFRAAKIDGKLYVGSHNMNLAEPKPYTWWEKVKKRLGFKVRKLSDNLYWKAAKRMHLNEVLKDGEQIFGEIYGKGIQDLTYGKNDFDVVVFDVVVDGEYLDHYEYMKFCATHNFKDTVTYTGRWKPELIELAEGKSTIDPTQIREGIVVKPLKERFSVELQGRCIVKVISNEYLLRKDATERH